MYIALEYVSYLIVLVVLAAILFAGSTLVVLSQEGAKYLAHNTRRVAERAVRTAAAAVKSTATIAGSAPHPGR